MKEKIREKSDCSLCDTKASGTFAWHTDIVGSLCINRRYGDKGTPIILVQIISTTRNRVIWICNRREYSRLFCNGAAV